MSRLLFVLGAALAWLGRLFRRTRLRATGRLADTSTMAEWEAMRRLPDDPLPAHVKPDPSAPYADLIRRVRLYAKDGAKALAPLLDVPLPRDRETVTAALLECQRRDQDGTASEILDYLCLHRQGCLSAVHAAYNTPWTIGPDGEPVEVVVPGATAEVEAAEVVH